MTDNLPSFPDDSGEFLLYRTEDGPTRIEVRMQQQVYQIPKLSGESFGR